MQAGHYLLLLQAENQNRKEALMLVAVLLDRSSDMKVWRAHHHLAAQSSEVLMF